MRVLIVEDEKRLAENIAAALRENGIATDLAHDGETGKHLAGFGHYDLVLLDLNLPNMDGLEVCRMIRRQSATAHVPIIIVSARGEEVDRVLGLEMGADDYVVKPFSLKELAARCRVALRRSDSTAGPSDGYRDEDFEVEFDSFVARYRGTDLRLTAKEFELFRVLIESAGRVLTRERLLDRVWGHDAEVDLRSVDAHVRRLRAKLGLGRNHVETVVGLGYRFVKDGDPKRQ